MYLWEAFFREWHLFYFLPCHCTATLYPWLNEPCLWHNVHDGWLWVKLSLAKPGGGGASPRGEASRESALPTSLLASPSGGWPFNLLEVRIVGTKVACNIRGWQYIVVKMQHPTQQKWHYCFNKELPHIVCRAMSIIVLLSTANFLIIRAVLGYAVGYMIRQCCDCVVHGREVWTGVQMCNSHNKGLC